MDDAPRFRQGAGRLCLDFIRTLRHRGTAGATEELPDGPALAAWVRQCGPHVAVEAAQAAPTGDGLALEARGLREAVYDLIAAARRPDGLGAAPRAAVDLVNRAAARPVPAPSLGAAGRLRWHTDDAVSAALALVARDALDLVTSAAVERVRECADPTCGALFLDGSRPGTRRWCAMGGGCGNRAKKTALRGRNARPEARPDARPDARPV